jgi:methionyl-tRNA formyltransferase
VRLLFAGTPDAAVPSLEALLTSDHEVVAVLTRPDAPAGRGRRVTASPVALRAAEAGIEVLKPRTPRQPEFLDRLVAIRPECAPVVAYGALLPQPVLDVPSHGWVNLHFSLLPAWRGAAPVQHTILAGDEVTGATTFRLVAEMDAGPVFGTVTERVRLRDTAGDLLERLARAGAPLLVSTLDHLAAGDLEPRPQPVDGVSYAPKVDAGDARVRWEDPAFAVDRRVRACTPFPGAWTTYAGTRLKLGPVQLAPEVADLAPGELAARPTGVHVGTGTHAVALGHVRPEGRKMMPAKAWVRGARPHAGVRLGVGD